MSDVMGDVIEGINETNETKVGATVFLHGLISRPILNPEPVPMTREDVIAMLRAALSHRIVWGTWGTGEE